MRKPDKVVRATVGGFVFAVVLLSSTGSRAVDDGDAGLMETSAAQAIVMDEETGTLLLEKNADSSFPPASLAKLMTAELAFDALDSAELTSQKLFPVSLHAWRTGGAPSGTSTMFAAVRSEVPLDALLLGLAVQNANDACIILAEGMDGSEAAFVERMNRRAGELGMTGSHFVNSTGLPQEGQYVTARDMALLAAHVIRSHPAQLDLYTAPDFEWNKIRQRNKSPLAGSPNDVVSLGAGYTEKVGYSIIALENRTQRKTLLVLAGLATNAERVKETKRLFDWANSNFVHRRLFSKDATVGSAPVFAGLASEVELVTHEDVDAVLPTKNLDRVRLSINYQTPLRAPIAKGQKIGELELRIGNSVSLRKDVFAKADVVEGTFSSQAVDAAKELAFGWIRRL